MKLSGFTMLRNGVKFDYPFLESLRSMLPLVDELIINVGRGEDDTLQVIRDFAQNEGMGKVQYFESTWPLEDPEKRRSGIILSEQTNLALERCTGDFCLYLQADEVLHEQDYETLRSALGRARQTPDVEGLLFDYVHFYGSFDVIQHTRSAYRREVRMIRRSTRAQSVGDAQSFRKPDGSKLKVLHTGARIFHYGWVRTPEAMREKTYFMDGLYHGIESAQSPEQGLPGTGENYRYKRFWGLKRFIGSHPAVMAGRIRNKNWLWDFENSPLVWGRGDMKKVISDMIERLTGWRPFEYRSYQRIG